MFKHIIVRNPEHPALSEVVGNTYDPFYKTEIVSPATRTHERQSDADSVARVHLSRNSWRNVVRDRVRLIEQKDIGATLARRVATIY